MSTEDNIALVRRYFDEVVNTGNLDAARTLFADSHMAHYTNSAHLKGHEGWKQYVALMYTGVSDTHVTIEDEIAAQDKVVVRYTVRGTHTGTFGDRAATGNAVKFTGIAIFQVANGKIVEQWQEVDAIGMTRQLGGSIS
jgi:steroid delta-isomerase-like uncharacterized protein